RHQCASVAREPERNGNLAFGTGLGRKRLVHYRIEAGCRDPLRYRVGCEAEAPVRELLAQEFLLVRRKVDDQQASARTQHARRLTDRARAVVKEVQNLMKDDDIEGIVGERQVVDVALPDAAIS